MAKHQKLYEATCGCVGTTILTKGTVDTDEPGDDIFEDCSFCEEPYKIKKKIKRKFTDDISSVIPDDIVEVL